MGDTIPEAEDEFPKELNILILGETGVGKSTWINSFMNFVTYSSLEEAETEELQSLIPTEFTVYNEDFKKITVTTGEDKNEVAKKGQSATQDSRVHTFDVKGCTIRLIDTPGIGDTRGIDQDKKNFENILNTIQGFSVIHGICILLKPNDARVTIMFRFCIKELLTHLHKDAVQNIVFCFTNSRGTFYRPGDTLPALEAVLEENKVSIISKNTMYCFDSEAYRFLAAIKNNPPVKFADEEKINFSKSWEKSITETNRLLNHICSLNPHQVKSTLSLNNARNIILKLTKPLADITRLIETNKKILEDEKKKIQMAGADIEKLQESLMVDRAVLELVKQGHPDTVCANPNCIEVHKDSNGYQAIKYVQKCHDKCRVSGVTADAKGHSELLKCISIDSSSGECKKCKHSYREHLHRYYHSIEKVIQVEDQTIRKILNEKIPTKAKAEKLIEEKDQKVAELKVEHDIIQEASVKFAHFLKSNAITPYNDAMQEYLDHLIREENYKVGQGGDRTVLEGLERHLDQYIKEKATLETAINSGNKSVKITLDEIHKTVKLLQNLKHNGKSLKEALDYVNSAAENVFQLSLNPISIVKKAKNKIKGTIKELQKAFF